MVIQVLQGDCRELLKTLPSNSVDCVVTSPPYYQLRRYCEPNTQEIEYEIGREKTPDEYIQTIVKIFREIKRTLKEEGTIWIVIGDCYNKQGELYGIPWKLAFALQNDGWKLIQDIVWEKGNCMPEPVKRRCTRSHEFIFLFAKTKKYYYNSEAIKEPSVSKHNSGNGFKRSNRVSYLNSNGAPRGNDEQWKVHTTRNKRDVWHVNTKPLNNSHIATFSEELIKPCIDAGCPSKGTVLDPFRGSGTVGAYCQNHGRNAVLIELKPEYISLIKERLNLSI